MRKSRTAEPWERRLFELKMPIWYVRKTRAINTAMTCLFAEWIMMSISAVGFSRLLVKTTLLV